MKVGVVDTTSGATSERPRDTAILGAFFVITIQQAAMTRSKVGRLQIVVTSVDGTDAVRPGVFGGLGGADRSEMQDVN